jgi:dolichol kinase
MAILEEHPTTPEQQVENYPSQITMTGELMRKSIHLTSIAIPILYSFLSREVMLWMLIPGLIVSFAIELFRFRSPAFEQFFMKIFGPILRSHEKSGKPMLNGATYVLLSATLCVLIFPRIIAIAGFAILIISDTAAALFGRRFGRHKFLDKSVEGSSAFFITGLATMAVIGVVFNAPTVYYIVGAIAALVSTVTEAMSYGINIDDNLTIPMSFGIVMWGVLALIGGPEIAAMLAK